MMKRAILIYMMLCLIAPITIEAKKKPFGNGLYWELTDDGTLTISGQGRMPDFTENKKKSNSPWCKSLEEGKISNVVIEEGITHIGSYSFCWYMPVTRLKQTEYNTEGLRSVKIPNSVSSIGESAFRRCSNLQSVVIPNSVTSIDKNAFWGCINLKSINIPNSVVSIGELAFAGCINFESILVPNSVTYIGKSAFRSCHNLCSIILPNSITVLEDTIFGDCKKLQSIDIPNSVKTIGNCAFGGCESMTSVTIPNSVTDFGWFAFHNCSNLVSLSIPNSVTTIGNGAFEGCVNLTSLVIPNSVTKIGSLEEQYVTPIIYGCKNLQRLTIPRNIKNVTEWTFAIEVSKNEDSYHLEKLFEGTLVSIPDYMMNNPKQWGLSNKSVDRYKYGIKDSNGKLILEGKEGWKVTICQLEDCSLYQVEENGKVGLVDNSGTWVVPLDKEYRLIESAGGNYIRVRDKNYNYGIITANGKEVIPPSRGYSSIGNFNKNSKTFSFVKNRYSGVCNVQGVESSVTKLPPSKYDIKYDGGYSDVSEITNNGTKYFLVSKGGKYGLTNAEGKQIIAPEMDALEQAGAGFLRFKINGFWGVMNYAGKVIIPTDRGYIKIGDYVSFTKRFPYEMDGYKGECNQLGQQVSKIKIASSTSTTASSTSSGKSTTTTNTTSSSSSNKQSENKTTTVVVEHHRDPVPMQVWVNCSSCWGSGKCGYCNGTGLCYSMSGPYSCGGCGGSGRCPMCAGRGGHYDVQYK